MAETHTMNGPAQEKSRQTYSLRRDLTRRFRVAWVWTRYLLAGRRQGLPALVDFVLRNHFFRAIQVRSELMALGEILAELRPHRALEIGTARGGTLLFLTRLASPTATIASIDLEGGEFGGGYGETRQWFYERFARRKQHLHLIRGDSHQFWMRRRLGEVFDGRPIDYLFIDGDHRYEGVKKDFEMFGPMVRKGGVIAFHDIVEGPPECVGGVPQFWREIKSGYQHQEIIEDLQQGGYGIGVLFVG